MKTSYSDLRRQVGQLMMVGFEGPEATPHVQNVLRGIQPGGVILFARNIQTAPQCHSLLAECRSVKVKRLFLWFAERHNHAWLKGLDREGIDLGRGKRMLVRGGKLDTKFNITVPENLGASG